MQEKGKGSALCQHGFPERNNYYLGKLMKAQDFIDEQSYLNEKRWMVNRLGLGWGVFCGLKVRPHRHDRRKVVVEPGFAIDPYGHEILVCQEETVDLLPGLDDCPPGGSAEKQADKPGPKSHLLYLSVKYRECGVNPSPVLIDSCEGHKEECVYNRTREGYRFIVSREKPTHGEGREPRCHHLLQDPSAVVGDCCPERPECEPVPLAAVCYNATTDTTHLDIDLSMKSRKVGFGNEALFELLSHLRDGAGSGAQHGRGRHVPLLAGTIRGLEYSDGRTTTLDQGNGYGGVRPHRLTSDGDYIWVTDREDGQVWRIDRATNRPIKDSRLDLEDPTWGIAFDGRHMWISHHDASGGHGEQPRAHGQAHQQQQVQAEAMPQGQRRHHGRLTRVDVCTLERLTIDGLPECRTLPDCYRFPEAGGAPGSVRLRPFCGEVVMHDGDIYVAHDVPKAAPRAQDARQDYDEARPQYPRPGYELYITRIDPVKGCIVEDIPVPETEEREALSHIRAMASDGRALWITYRASSRDHRGERAVVRKITKEDGKSVVGEAYPLRGRTPEHIAFDGTRIWVSHNDGLSAVDIETGDEDRVNTDASHNALAYTGGQMLWAVVPGQSEAFVTWVDIFSEAQGQRMQFLEAGPQTTFEVSDMQFDGAHLYIAYHLTEGRQNRGVIHRLLP